MQTEYMSERSKVTRVLRQERVVHSLPGVMAGGGGWGNDLKNQCETHLCGTWSAWLKNLDSFHLVTEKPLMVLGR